MNSYGSFFATSAGVAGALTGLLFVALSVAPVRPRYKAGTLEHQAIAATAFTALIDALFVSLGGLVPGGGGTRVAGLTLGLLGLSSTAGLISRLWRVRGEVPLSRRWPILLVSIFAVYAAQSIESVTATVTGSESNSVTFILIMFGVGIARSWELLGLSGGGPLDLLGERLDRAARPAAVHNHGETHDDQRRLDNE